MQNFRTYQLAKELFHQSQSVKLASPAKDQFQRAVLSIALNLAEGSGKETNADRRRFYQIAMGSLREAQAIIDLYNLEGLKKAADVLGAHVFRLCQSLRQ
ncbi:MAG: four helix bundle protein, partial [Bdellovibrionales bacterium]